jgi:hypothetical protein
MLVMMEAALQELKEQVLMRSNRTNALRYQGSETQLVARRP